VVREAFVTHCSATGGPSMRDICGCVYRDLEQTVPFDRFVTFDESVQREGMPDVTAGLRLGSEPGTVTISAVSIPTEIETIVVGCVARARISTGSIPPATAVAR
jgi:hypothetical protein